MKQQKILTEKELLSGKIQVLKTELDNKMREEDHKKAEAEKEINEITNNTARYEAEAKDHER